MSHQKETVNAKKMWLYTIISIIVIALLLTIAMSVVFNGNGDRSVSSCEKNGGVAQVDKSKVLFITTSYKVECQK